MDEKTKRMLALILAAGIPFSGVPMGVQKNAEALLGFGKDNGKGKIASAIKMPPSLVGEGEKKAWQRLDVVEFAAKVFEGIVAQIELIDAGVGKKKFVIRDGETAEERYELKDNKLWNTNDPDVPQHSVGQVVSVFSSRKTTLQTREVSGIQHVEINVKCREGENRTQQAASSALNTVVSMFSPDPSVQAEFQSDYRNIGKALDVMVTGESISFFDSNHELNIKQLTNPGHPTFIYRASNSLRKIADGLNSGSSDEKFASEEWKKYITNMPDRIYLVFGNEDTGECNIFPIYLGDFKVLIFEEFLADLYRSNSTLELTPYEFFESKRSLGLPGIINDSFGNVRCRVQKRKQGGFLAIFDSLASGLSLLSGTDLMPDKDHAINVAYDVFMNNRSSIEKAYYKMSILSRRIAAAGMYGSIALLSYQIPKHLVKMFFSSFGFFQEKVQDKMLTSVRQVSGDPMKLRAAIEAYLFKVILGRNDIIPRLASDLASIMLLNNAKEVQNKRKSTMLAFNGPTGTGKTFTIQKISEVLTGASVPSTLYLTASMLKGTKLREYFSEGSVPFQQVNGKQVVIVIDEFDKLTDEEREETENFFRDAVDYGRIQVNPKVETSERRPKRGFASMNVNGCIMIFSSNASPESWHDHTTKFDPIGVQHVKISDSFASRVSLYYFHDFPEEVYGEFYRKWFLEINKFLLSSKIHLICDDSTIKSLAQFSVDVRKGARSVEEITANIIAEVTKVSTFAVSRLTKFLQNLPFYPQNEKMITIKIDFDAETRQVTAKQVATPPPAPTRRRGHAAITKKDKNGQGVNPQGSNQPS